MDETFEKYMFIAVAEAQLSKSEGNLGFGAVVVLEGKILSQAHDTAVSCGDPSRHAEMNALRQAVKNYGNPDLSGAVLFSTCEPCPMCSAMAVWCKVSTIVYGASIEETVRLGRTRIRISAREIASKSPFPVEVIGGILRDECLSLYS